MVCVSFQKRSLVQQGYSHLSHDELASLRWGLRFTPTVCMMVAVYGLVTHNPSLLLVVAGLGIIPFWFPARQPLDRFYNAVIAPLLGATRLPANPLPRRVACVSAGAMNAMAATAFLMGAPLWAYVFGGTLFVLQVIVNTTHFCLASFSIEMMLKMFGKSLPTAIIDGSTARTLVHDGALLIDVRHSSEHMQGHIPGSENLPLGELSKHIDRLLNEQRPIVLYCLSGGRSKLAHGLLAQKGVCGLHNLGALDRW